MRVIADACFENANVSTAVQKHIMASINISGCEIDIERCVGCEVCVHIPGKKTNPYDLKVCPWDAIEMIPTEEVAVAVSQMGGPPDYVEENWDRLVDTAQHLAELKAAK